MAKQTFLSVIKREGESGSIRGKIPAGLIKAINASEGCGVQFMVHGTTLVGAKVLSKKETKEALKEKASEAPVKKTSVSKGKVGKAVKKTTAAPPVKKGHKKPKPLKKGSKRRTEVEYDEPPKIKKGKKNKKGKFSKALHK